MNPVNQEMDYAACMSSRHAHTSDREIYISGGVFVRNARFIACCRRGLKGGYVILRALVKKNECVKTRQERLYDRSEIGHTRVVLAAV